MVVHHPFSEALHHELLMECECKAVAAVEPLLVASAKVVFPPNTNSGVSVKPRVTTMRPVTLSCPDNTEASLHSPGHTSPVK